MSKITIDIEYVKDCLSKIGYQISDCIEKENNGKFWQIKFHNSGAVVNIYDTNNKNNTCVNGKCEGEEKKELKELVDNIKCKRIEIDSINSEIVNLINSKKEDENYDFKREWHDSKKLGDLIHDILCLSNNTRGKDSYLIFGVSNNFEICGVDKQKNSEEIYDLLKGIKFAGDHMPKVEIKHIYYQSKKIDVLVCKKSKYIPIYLAERYRDVNPFHIYTRVGDTNTPKAKNASYEDVEKLWEMHFNISKE